LAAIVVIAQVFFITVMVLHLFLCPGHSPPNARTAKAAPIAAFMKCKSAFLWASSLAYFPSMS
jgi:hypothetical protein